MSVHSLRYQSFSENIRLSMDSTDGGERLSINVGNTVIPLIKRIKVSQGVEYRPCLLLRRTDAPA